MRALAPGVLLLCVVPAQAQDPGSVYQKPRPFKFTLEALAREEWTRDIFVAAGAFRDEHRWRLQARPALEARLSRFTLAAGGDLDYSQDANFDASAPPLLLRDNYDSRDARLDLAFARFDASWLRVEGGRFAMPVALTEMIWDKDLRPQGGALKLSLRDRGHPRTVGLTGLYARSSHVFAEETEVLVGSVEAVFKGESESRSQLLASYVEFRNTGSLPAYLRRQNSRVVAGGPVKGPFRILDGVLRLSRSGMAPLQLVADYCWNTAVDSGNRGLWLSAVLGSSQTRLRLEYTFARVDSDATLGAYATDDFFWATGWRGHRGDAGVRFGDKTSLHAVGQWQRFKDSPRPEERDHVVKRYRLELRFKS